MVLLRSAEMAGMKHVWLVPDCCAASVLYGQFDMMGGRFENQSYTSMFVDMGASHTSAFISEYAGVLGCSVLLRVANHHGEVVRLHDECERAGR